MRSNVTDPNTETQQWSRFCKGDRQAFDMLYAVYFPVLFQYCIRFTHDRNLIKDVLQEFFITLFLKPPKAAAVQHWKSYLLVSVRRQLVKAIAREATSFTSLQNEDTYDFELELAADAALIEKQDDGKRTRTVQQLINQLSARQREAVYLYFFENIPYEQIADILGMKEVKYARTLIYRALDDIRAALAGNSDLAAAARDAASLKAS